MTQRTFSSVKLVATHRPDYSREKDDNGITRMDELPGFVDIALLIDGATVPLTSIKAGAVLAAIDKAKAAAPPPPPPADS